MVQRKKRRQRWRWEKTVKYIPRQRYSAATSGRCIVVRELRYGRQACRQDLLLNRIRFCLCGDYELSQFKNRGSRKCGSVEAFYSVSFCPFAERKLARKRKKRLNFFCSGKSPSPVVLRSSPQKARENLGRRRKLVVGGQR